MKKHLPVAIIIAATLLAFLSFKLFSPKTKPSFDLTGRWVVDSAYSNDSLISSILQKQVAENPVYIFNADSTAKRLSLKDSALLTYYRSDSSVFIKEDSLYAPYRLGILNNSLITLTKDSVQFRLVRQ
jgi:hypothetical protein